MYFQVFYDSHLYEGDLPKKSKNIIHFEHRMIQEIQIDALQVLHDKFLTFLDIAIVIAVLKVGSFIVFPG